MRKAIWNPNVNHPVKGSTITVDPIRDPQDLKNIKRLLSGENRNLLLFVAGINNGLRCGDLLTLKVGDLRDLKPGQTLRIKESKTGKTNFLMINKSVHKALGDYLNTSDLSDGDYLFKSKKGSGPLSVIAVNLLMKKWCKAVGIKGNFGSHTLRKTFGYQQRVRFGTSIELICKRFNHSSPAGTLRYLGVEDREVSEILLNEL